MPTQLACAGGPGPNYTIGFYLKWTSTLVLDAKAGSGKIWIDNYRLVTTYGLHLAHTGGKALSEINSCLVILDVS